MEQGKTFKYKLPKYYFFNKEIGDEVEITLSSLKQNKIAKLDKKIITIEVPEGANIGD